MTNYYQILGVHTSAEDLVIKAAYRVLAQKYHPDKWRGDPAISEKKMREINEAYRVLSDPDLRKSYDRDIGEDDFEANDDRDARDLDEEFGLEVNESWAMGAEFYPKIEDAYKRLRRVNIMLASAFKLFVVENQVFSKANQLAEEWERSFLERYFGRNEVVLATVHRLISEGKKDDIRKINKYINALGSDVRPEWILEKVLGKDYQKSGTSGKEVVLDIPPTYKLMEIAKGLGDGAFVSPSSPPSSPTVEKCLILLIASGGGYRVSYDKYKVTYEDRTVTLDAFELLEFTRKKIRPKFL
jgi:curved DNA-binding protein CbpA